MTKQPTKLKAEQRELEARKKKRKLSSGSTLAGQAARSLTNKGYRKKKRA